MQGIATLALLTVALPLIVHSKTYSFSENGIAIGYQDKFTEYESQKIKVWKDFPQVFLRRRPPQDLRLAINLDMFDIIRASLKPIASETSLATRCKIMVNQKNEENTHESEQDKEKAAILTKTVNFDIYKLDSTCAIWKEDVSPKSAGKKPVDFGKLDLPSCSADQENTINAFEEKVLISSSSIQTHETVRLEGSLLKDYSGKSILEKVTKFRYIFTNSSSIADAYKNHNECILCQDQIFPLQWSLRDHASLLGLGSKQTKGVIAVADDSLVYVNLKPSDTNQGFTKDILVTGLPEVLDLIVEENSLVILTKNAFRNEPDVTICSIFADKLLCETLTYDPFMNLTPSVANALAHKSIQKRMHSLKENPSSSGLQFWCPSGGELEENHAPEEYQLNLTLKNCPQKLEQLLMPEDMCHYSLLIKVQTEMVVPLVSPGLLNIVVLILLIVLLCLAGYLFRLRQLLQNQKLMAEIAQIELDTLKLTAEYANKVKPLEKELDEFGETDFEPYQGQ